MPIIEHLLFVTALFLALSIIASKVAARSGIPILLLFMALGMLAGSEGIGGIFFNNAWLAQAVGVVALVLILFSGGLDTRLADVRPVLRPGIILATLGVGITALSVGLFAHWFLGFSLYEGILLGAIISSTDAAAVFTLLRGSGIYLKARLKPLLELESGSNDPMAVLLTLGMIQLIQMPESSPLSLLSFFVVQMSLGALFGWLVGRLAVWSVNRLRLEFEGLYPVLTLTMALVAYALPTVLGGNGFLSAYLAGLLMGNRDFIHRNSLLRFHEGVAWLAQIAMFLTLGLLVFPSQLVPVIDEGFIVAMFLIFVARPLSVFVGLLFERRLNIRKRLFISWVGLRGAAPVILATFPLLAGLAKAEIIFNLVFFIVITSVVIQGMSLTRVARWLKVDAPPPEPRSSLAQALDDGKLADNVMELMVSVGCGAVGKQLLDLQLPSGSLVVLIGRGRETIVPNGGTVIEPNDTILLVTRDESRETVQRIFS